VEIHQLSGSEVDGEHDSLDEQEMDTVDTNSTISVQSTAITPKLTSLEPRESVEIPQLSGSDKDGEHDSLNEQELDTSSTISMQPTAITPKLTPLEPRESVEIPQLSGSDKDGEHDSLNEQELDTSSTISMQPTAITPKLTPLEPRESVEIHQLLSGSEEDGEHDSLNKQEIDASSTISVELTTITPKSTPLEPRESVETHQLSGSEEDGEHDSLNKQEIDASSTISVELTTITPKSIPLGPRESVEIHQLLSGSEEDGEHDSLNEQEIDAVMKQLNEDGSGLGVERLDTPQPHSGSQETRSLLPDILGGILENRLYPLERTLNAIQQSVSLLESQSASKAQRRRLSDADDEDEEETSGYRSRSPLSKRDRHAERLKNAVLEALAANQVDERAALQDADRWRSEMEGVKTENENLRRTINSLKNKMEENVRARQNLREKFDRLQDDIVSVTRDIARDQASWRRKEQEHAEKYDALRFAYEQEVKLRQDQVNDVRAELETKIAGLESQLENAGLDAKSAEARYEAAAEARETAFRDQCLVHECALNKIIDLESQLENAELDAKSAEARYKAAIEEVQNLKACALQDAAEARETALCDERFIHECALNKIIDLESQLENAELDAKSAEARHKAAIEEVQNSKTCALQDAAEARETALRDERLIHEHALNDLRERHARALHNASEDKQRCESHLMELMSLRDDKVAHLEDKIAHLEEKLEIAKDAARAAARAAQAVKGVPTVSPSHSTSPSLSFVRGSEIPEKISPQALRESIMVLQDQLQQRESRIEELQRELSTFDKDAPTKLKEKDIEIDWLRELLGVRIDELQAIIDTLSQPSFENDTVRDAAIRLKANLQMGQQEKDRAMGSGSNPFPSLASISSLAASSRSLPLAAAAAWGNWRKGRENSISSNISESSNRGDDHRTQTPSKTNVDLQAFWSGLLTPPTSNTPQTRRTLNFESSPSRPLLRRSSYDHDAQPYSD
jgi:hypothetical protein